MSERNVLGGELEPCGTDPLTGFYRDGCCSTGPEDLGSHTICALVTAEFLEHQRSVGNDLSTPMPQYHFPGLVPGDRWCVTAVNWARAFNDGVAAPVVLASTNHAVLEIVPLDALQLHAVDVPADPSADLTHPDLAANVVGGMNCSRGGKQSYGDENGHGTHVAGIIAALDNGIGVVGVAPEAKLWAVRVLDKTGAGPLSDVVCGVDFVDSLSPAKGGPITIANMSVGGLGADDGRCGTTNSDALHLAVCRTVGDGVTFVAAAANSGMDLSQAQTFVPAAYDEVITVTALADANGAPCGGGASMTYGADDDFAYFSNFATSSTDIAHLMAAPGVNINSTWKGGGYGTKSGTSMASPHVAGAVALYLASHPGATPSSVRDALRVTAEPPDTNLNGECGAAGSTKRGTSSAASHTDSSARHPEPAVRADSL